MGWGVTGQDGVERGGVGVGAGWGGTGRLVGCGGVGWAGLGSAWLGSARLGSARLG